MIERVVPAGDGWFARVRCSQVSEGDFRCAYDDRADPGRREALERRRQRLMSGQWTWLRQVHGADVVVVTEPGGCAGAVADGAVTAVPEAVRRAAPAAPTRGLRAVIGPVIRPSSYEFGADELAAVAAATGCDVGAVTSWGTPALDLCAAVRGALEAAGVSDVEDLGLDTATDGFFSHRARGDRGRHATATRLEKR